MYFPQRWCKQEDSGTIYSSERHCQLEFLCKEGIFKKQRGKKQRKILWRDTIAERITHQQTYNDKGGCLRKRIKILNESTR